MMMKALFCWLLSVSTLGNAFVVPLSSHRRGGRHGSYKSGFILNMGVDYRCSGALAYGVVIERSSWAKFRNRVGYRDDELEEDDIEVSDYIYSYYEWGWNAIESILNNALGEGHGLTFSSYSGGDYYLDDDEYRQSFLVLEHAASKAKNGFLYFGAEIENLSLPFVRNVDIDENLARAVRAFGVEAGEPGWKLITTFSRA